MFQKRGNCTGSTITCQWCAFSYNNLQIVFRWYKNLSGMCKLGTNTPRADMWRRIFLKTSLQLFLLHMWSKRCITHAVPPVRGERIKLSGMCKNLSGMCKLGTNTPRADMWRRIFLKTSLQLFLLHMWSKRCITHAVPPVRGERIKFSKITNRWWCQDSNLQPPS
jgi:hypothetical protein